MSMPPGEDVEVASAPRESSSLVESATLLHRGSAGHSSGNRRWACTTWWGAATLLGSAALLSTGISLQFRARAAARAEAAATFKADEVKRACGRMEVGVDYASNSHVFAYANVSSAAECCARCEEEVRCGAWTWGLVRNDPELTDMCFLTKLDKNSVPNRTDNPLVVSGLPPKMINTTVSSSLAAAHAKALGWSAPPRPDGDKPPKWASVYRSASLYCFSLAAPTGYEKGLLKFQFDQGVSIFACDEFAVYSNTELSIAPGVPTSLVDSDLKCENGGEFGTALNLKIFLAVWTAVITDGRFRYHGWTAKVDPDSVFFPDRLRGILAYQREDSDGGIYLNNCKYGLHGPLEVFSRRAVQAWALGSEKCVRHFTQVCSGDCFWGEDMFVDQCLWKVLKVKRLDEFSLITEDHCDPPPSWRSCKDPLIVAFHPFKSLDMWKGCWENATEVPSE